MSDARPATGLGVSRDTIQGWYERGLIPRLRHAARPCTTDLIRSASLATTPNAFAPIVETVLASVSVDSLADD